ncbi:MAG TPA: ATP-grasp domain-containing protein [Actinophytocola sp.]|uniref:ATP-grasp domain-containing protein n=1 Tax=Actinophytocola sp. TaxID=1872138 RepID=UPI002E04C377|nr:ATP-grasp domain-containing protein [Actinophytocola sp.]
MIALVLLAAPDREVAESALAQADRVVVLSPAQGGPGTPDDDRVTFLRYDGADDALAIAAAVRPDAVIPIWEGAVETGAVLAEALGLPGNPPTATRAARDKAVAADLLHRARVPHPRTRSYPVDTELSFVEREFRYPFIVKMPRSSNSQSVTLVRSRAELATAVGGIRTLYARTNRLSRLYGTGTPSFVAQDYLHGVEVNIDLLYHETDHAVLGIFEKFPMPGPTFGEVHSVYPHSLSTADADAAIAVSVAAVRALGATRGAAHVELRMTVAGPVVVEAALRLGGFLTPQALRLVTGVDPVSALTALHGHGRLPSVRHSPSGVACLYGAANVEQAGRIKAISGADDAKLVPGVELLEVVKQPGDLVVPLPEGTDYHVARFLLTGARRADVEHSARRIRELLVVELEEAA